jgi:hypothetical protein
MTKAPWDLSLSELSIRQSVLNFLSKFHNREPTAEEIAIDALLLNANDMLEAEVNRLRKRGLIVEALKQKNRKAREWAVRIAGSDPELLHFVAAYHHRIGREKGEARSSDLPVYVKGMRAELAADAQRILAKFSVTQRLARLFAITHRFNLNLSDLSDADKKLITHWLRKLNIKRSNTARDRRRSS